MEIEYDISKETSIEVGGKVKYFEEVNRFRELLRYLHIFKLNRVKVFFIGDGTNVLFPDEVSEFAVIKNKIRGIKLLDDTLVEVYSGERLSDLIEFLQDKGLSGFERLSGIPGTVGGAVFGNAGAYGVEIKDFIEELYFIDSKINLCKKSKRDLKFSYRWSEFKKNYGFIYKIVFNFKKDDKKKIKERIQEILEKRIEKLPPPPPLVKSSGSFFKNIILENGEKVAVAKLIDSLGFKGKRVGGAMVSEKHANFLINTGGAKFSDFLKLSNEIKESIRKKYKYRIEEEVIFVKNFVEGMKNFPEF